MLRRIQSKVLMGGLGFTERKLGKVTPGAGAGPGRAGPRLNYQPLRGNRCTKYPGNAWLLTQKETTRLGIGVQSKERQQGNLE